jgi:hypothetical protein
VAEECAFVAEDTKAKFETEYGTVEHVFVVMSAKVRALSRSLPLLPTARCSSLLSRSRRFAGRLQQRGCDGGARGYRPRGRCVPRHACGCTPRVLLLPRVCVRGVSAVGRRVRACAGPSAALTPCFAAVKAMTRINGHVFGGRVVRGR